jgi:hypothetical protein
VVTLYIDGYPDMIVNTSTMDGSGMAPPYYDVYQFTDITALLANAGLTGQAYTATIEMRCGYGNNVHRNTTPTTAHVNGIDDGNTHFASIMELEPCPVSGYTDLNVSEILLNPGDKRATDIPRIYVNDVNNVSAVVWNNGTEAAGEFDVCFKDDLNGVTIGSVTVPAGLAAGSSTMVSIPDWTPTCADYDVQPGFPSQSLPITINVTADCNSEVFESDETNNTLLKHVPAIMPCSTYPLGVISGVVNNGYRSKNFDCNTAEEPLDEFMQPTDWIVGGGVVYNVSGAKTSSAEGYFPPQDTRTRVHQINLPTGAGVVDARLYVYAADKGMGTKDYPTGCLPNMVVNFESTDLTPDVVYADTKGFGKYLGPKATTVFDVTSLVSGSGSYTAIVKNDESAGGNTSTLLGEMLVVVYEGADHGDEVKIWMLEGVDYLNTMDKRNGHGKYDYSVSPYESTATVGFGGILENDLVETANLTAVVFYGGKPGENLLFNGNTVKTDAWLTEAYPGSEVRVANVPVENYLSASGNNNMGFEDDLPAATAGGFNAAGAFLVVKKKSEVVVSGDVNGDGRLTTADATIVLQMAVRGEYSEVADVSRDNTVVLQMAVRGEYSEVADVSRDNTVTSLDALMILQAVDTES